MFVKINTKKRGREADGSIFWGNLWKIGEFC